MYRNLTLYLPLLTTIYISPPFPHLSLFPPLTHSPTNSLALPLSVISFFLTILSHNIYISLAHSHIHSITFFLFSFCIFLILSLCISFFVSVYLELSLSLYLSVSLCLPLSLFIYATIVLNMYLRLSLLLCLSICLSLFF